MEIGPGQGAITNPILQMAAQRGCLDQFWMVERDRKIADHWAEQIKSTPPEGISVQIESSDFLDLEVTQWAKLPQFAVVSNLPYSAGTAIFTRLAALPDRIPAMVLMFQLEVAERLRAEPSTKGRGSLSIWTQNVWDVKKLMVVPPKAFIPPPEVTSEVVVLTRRAQPRIIFPPEMDKLWNSFLKTCFSQRRKMLRSVLPWRNALELSGVDGTKRAEALDWEEWNRLFQAVAREVTRI